MKLSQWRYSLFLMLPALLLLADNVHAVGLLGVKCTASMSTTILTLTPDNGDNASISGTLNYSCTNSDLIDGFVSVCFAVDGGDSASGTLYPRYMKNAGSSNSLAFTMTLPDNTLWGSRTYRNQGTEYYSGPISIPARPPFGSPSTISGSVPIKISLLAGYNNALVTTGTYSNDFGNGNHTSLTFDANTNKSSSNCLSGNQGSIRFPFKVQATIINSCEITTTSDINLGSHSARTTNIAGNNPNAIGVKCTNGAPYTIGLQPSNNNQDGAGVMSASGGNNDKVPYQLRSTAGLDGKIWGNTATSTSEGNGISGKGKGSDQAHTVYVTVPSVDFTPDSYSDRVTIRINY